MSHLSDCMEAALGYSFIEGNQVQVLCNGDEIFPAMLDAINEIYKDRCFTVWGSGVESQCRPQRAGISQGCPLFPFLFGIVMTVLGRHQGCTVE